MFLCVCVFFLVLLGKYEDACLVFHFGISASTFWWGRKLILVFFFPWRERKESTEPAYAYKALDYTHSTYLDCLKSSEVQGTIQRLKIGSFNINMFPISGCNPLQDTDEFDLHEVNSSGTFALEIIQHLRAAHIWPQEQVCGLTPVTWYPCPSLWIWKLMKPLTLTTQDWFELSAIRNLTNGCWWAGCWFEILACLDESYHSIF